MKLEQAASLSPPRRSSCLVELVISGLMVLMFMLGMFLASGMGFSYGYSVPEDCTLNRNFPVRVLRWCDLINEYSVDAGLPPNLIAALIWQESGGNPQAYSRSGAVGLMQVMPRDGIAASFVCKGKPCFRDRPSVQELKDPRFNIQYGTKMLQALVELHGGDLREALKDYGPMDVEYTYADTVLALYDQYGMAEEP